MMEGGEAPLEKRGPKGSLSEEPQRRLDGTTIPARRLTTIGDTERPSLPCATVEPVQAGRNPLLEAI